MTRFLSFLTVLILLLFAAALALPAVIDWNAWKPEIQDQISRRLGYPVRIDGDLSVVLLPVPSVRMTEIAVGGGDDQTRPFTLAGLEAAVAVAPLLGGEIRATRITLREPEIRFERHGDAPLWPPVMTALTQAIPSSLRLDEVDIRGGRLIAADNVLGQQWQADIVSATIGADSLTGPWQVQADMRVSGIPVILDLSTGRRDADGGMAISSTINLEGGAQFLFTGQADWSAGLLTGRLQGGMDSPPLTLDAALQADADDIRFDGMTVKTGDRTFSGAVRIDGGGGRPRIAVAMDTPALALNDPVGETLTGGLFAGEAGGMADVFSGWRDLAGHDALALADWSVRLSAEAFGWDGEGAEDMTLRLDVENGRINGDATIARLAGGGEARLTVASTDSRDRLAGSLHLTGDNADLAVGWLPPLWRPPAAEDSAGDIALDSNFTIDPVSIRLTDLSVKSVVATGEGSVSFTRADVGPSVIDVDFSAGHLKLDPFWRMLASFRRNPEAADMRLRLNARQMDLAGNRLSGVEFDGRLTRGGMAMETFRINTLPGVMAGLSPFEVESLLIQPRPGAAFLTIDARAGTPPSPLHFAAAISGDDNGFSWRNLKFEHDDRIITGSGSLTGSVERPALAAQLDLSELAFGAGPLAQLIAGESESGPWSGDAINWDGLTAWDIDVMATADQSAFAPVRMVSARLTGDDQGMKLSAQGLVSDGTADLSLSLTPRPPRITAALDILDADAADLTRALWGTALFDGPMDVSLRIDGAGSSGLTLMSSMSGDGRFNISGGALHGVDMPVLAISLPETRTLEDLSVLMATTVGAGKTPFDEFGGRITLEDGVLESTPVMRMDSGRGQAILVADLTRLIVDGSLELSFGDSKIPPLGIVAAGPFSAPDVVFETQAIEQIVGNQILQELLPDASSDEIDELLAPRQVP